MTAQPEPAPGPHTSARDDQGVYVPGSLAYLVWLALREHAKHVRLSGYEVRPELMAVLLELRAAASAHMCVSGQGDRTLPHDRASDRLVTTGELAGRLGVTGFHVRRLAKAAGISRVAHGRWAPEDAERLVALRKDHNAHQRYDRPA